MDPISQTRFDTLRKTDPANWTEADREFMRARRSYLPSEEVSFLGLDEESPSASKETSSEPVAHTNGKTTKKSAA